MAETKLKTQAINVDAIYPIGSIYMSVVSTNPNTFFGGTWSAWGTGRVPVGIDTGQTEFNTVEETGGAKTHQLSVAELASHSHYLTVYENGAAQFVPNRTGSLGNTTAITPIGTSDTGSNTAHNNLQPYITCYMWKRTS